MKTILLIGLLVLFSITISAQDKDVLCEEINLGCIVLGGNISGKHVIQNNTEYESLLINRYRENDCSNYQLPNIDFDNYTLIGYVCSAGGCSPPIYSKKITQATSQYFINLEIIKQGHCKINHTVEIWCLIPKIQRKKDVQFNIEIL